MTITDGGQVGAEQREPSVFDAVADDSRLSSTEHFDVSRVEFEKLIVHWDETDALKVALLTVRYLSGGHADVLIDEAEMCKVMGRKRNTIKSFLRSLCHRGWLKLDAKVNEQERPTFVYRTTKTIG